MKKKLFYLISGILVLIICFTTASLNAKSMSNKGNDIKHSYYDEEEKVYREKVESVLNKYGLYNSGISMTSVSDENGMRYYTVKINNRYASTLLEEEVKGIFTELGALLFADGICDVQHEFRQ